ncbi:MAG: hypothetical protein ACRCYV_04215 [Aeromonas sp.]
MRFEYALTLGAPSAWAQLERACGGGWFSASEVLATLGLVQHREPVGMDLVQAKFLKDAMAWARAELALRAYVRQRLGGLLRRGVYPRQVTLAPRPRQAAFAVRVLAKLVLAQFCRTADSPGAACRCRGRGVVVSRADGQQKVCERCQGSGMRPWSMTPVRSALQAALGEVLTPVVWREVWSVVYADALVWCEQEANAAARCYQQVLGVGG